MAQYSTEFEAALEGFRAAAEGMLRDHFAKHGYTFAIPNVEIVSKGRRFAKLIRTETNPKTGAKEGQTSVHSFVEIASGDIFKPATFKAPAKHARGNIYDDNGRDSMTADAFVKYLR